MHPQTDYVSLRQWNEDQLYCNLSDPLQWPLPIVPSKHRDDITVLYAFAEPRSTSTRQTRLYRAQEHRRTAQQLRSYAAHEQGPAKRAKFQTAAQLNEGLAETLEILAQQTLENEPTTQERKAATELHLRDLKQKYEILDRQSRRGWRARTRTSANQKLQVVSEKLRRARDELNALVLEEEANTARARREWDALNEAKRLVAEAHGRAKFKGMEPFIRDRLCTQWRACEQVARYQDETALTMAIADVLVTIGTTIPVATLAVLVVKIGVKKFCNCSA